MTGHLAERLIQHSHTARASRRLSLLIAAPLAGCTGPPAVNVVGSYFPAWMLCTLIGLVAAVCLRQTFIVCRLEEMLLLPLVTHAAVALAVTLAVWLVWFGH